MEILSFPIGVVVGLLSVTVSLSPEELPASLSLDNVPVCHFQTTTDSCTVNVGPVPHVARLELRSLARPELPKAVRWLNRPAPAEAHLQGDCQLGTCRFQVSWAHPEKLSPREIVITGNGVTLVQNTASFSLGEEELPASLLVQVSFPDGSTAVSAWRPGGQVGENSEVQLTSYPVVAAADSQDLTPGLDLGMGVTLVEVEERAPCAMVVVAAPHAAADVTSSSKFPCEHVELVLAVEGLPRLTLSPEALQLQRFSRLLAAFSSKYKGSALQLGDGLAAGAWRLASFSGPRLAVVWLAGSEEDRSRISLADAQRYASELGVLVRLWGRHRHRSLGAVDISKRLGLESAIGDLEQTLAKVKLLWLEGPVHPRYARLRLPAGVEPVASHAWAAGAKSAVFREEVEVTAVRIPVVAEGAGGENLQAEDLEVSEDGKPVEVIALEPLRSPGQRKEPLPVVIYLAGPLLEQRNWPPPTDLVTQLAASLTQVGPVTVVVATPRAQAVAESLANPAALTQVLQMVHLGSGGNIGRVRQRFSDFFAAASTSDHSSFVSLATAAQAAVREEELQIQQALAELGRWLATQPKGGVLVLVAGELSFESWRFYEELLSSSTARGSERELARWRSKMAGTSLPLQARDLSAHIASRGWLLVGLATNAGEVAFVAGAERSGRQRFKRFVGESAAAGAVPWAAFHAADGLAELAQWAGGGLIRGKDSANTLRQLVDRAFLLTYQAARQADTLPHSVTVAPRHAKVRLRAPAKVIGASPELVAEGRVRDFLASPRPGELEVETKVTRLHVGGEQEQGELEIAINLTDLAPTLERLGKGTLRVTLVAVEGEKIGKSFVFHDTVKLTPGVKAWQYKAPIQWDFHAGLAAVGVEELTTGAWGGAFIKFPE